MIRFVIVPGLRYTLRPLLRPLAGVDTPPVEVMLYRDLFESDSLPSGTWIFCDIERLGMWELRLAGEIARLMRKAGSAFRVINDPAHKSVRFQGGRLQLFGISLPLLPVFSINNDSTGATGSTGWLVPDFSLSTKKGLEVAFPYHWQIGPNRDLTLTPHLYTGVWPALG